MLLLIDLTPKSRDKGDKIDILQINFFSLFFPFRLDVHFEDSQSDLQECSSYNYTGDMKSGCDFLAKTNTVIGVLFNATLNNTVVWNTFPQYFLKG